MRLAVRAWFVALATIGAAIASARADDRIPVETFFSNPDIGSAKLSPSGTALALTTSNGSSRVFLAVIDVGRGKREPRLVANFADADVHSFDWVNDERLVFNTIDNTRPLNDQRFGPGLFSVKRDGTDMRMLVRPRYDAFFERSVGSVEPLAPNHELMRTLADGGDDVIVGEYKFTLTGELDWINPKRLNTATGRAVSLARGAPEHARSWVFDGSGAPRALTTLYHGEHQVFVREGEGWTSISKSSSVDVPFRPVAIDGDDQLYVIALKGGYGTLARFDPAARKPEPDALVSAKGFDLAPSLRFEAKSQRLLGVGYETDARSAAWFDRDYKKLQSTIDARFPGRVNTIACGRVCSGASTVLVASYSDQDPGMLYLYHREDDAWESIGPSRGAVDPARMAQLDFHRTAARDGEDLPIWVTTPPGKTDQPRPAVVLVHGGPWVRGGHWQWNPDAQFLASRGYVVLEPEYRGSIGYGSRHFRKGFKQWGLAMQDDLVDTVQWAAAKGLVDPNRVCIAGASYGGYATFMSLVKYPDAYRCGVAWVAVSDPRLLFENRVDSDISVEAQQYSMPTMIGDPVADAAMLAAATPVDRAKEIRAPVLMAYGGKDVRVPIEHGKRMRAALREAGREPEYVVYEGEGHGFLKVSNRVDFWTRVEKFLATNLR